MQAIYRTRRAALALVALTAILLGTGSAVAAEVAASISGLAFQPANLTINAGDRVTWTNSDSVPHTVSSTTGAFDTGTINAGATASLTFNTAGSFPFRCNIHTEMTGVITVQAPAATATATTAAPTATTAAPTATTATATSAAPTVSGTTPTVQAPATGTGLASTGGAGGDRAIFWLAGGLLAIAAGGSAVLVAVRHTRR